jgi:hypothetical protein
MGRSFFALLLVCVAVCSAHAQPASPYYVVTSGEIADRLSIDEFRAQQMSEIVKTLTADEVRARLMDNMTDKTKKVIDYGNNKIFIQYSSADGRTYTWQPESTEVIKGAWQIESDSAGATTVCFKADTAPSPTCIPAPYVLSEYCTIGMASKDVFSLMSGVVPFEKEMLAVPQ